MLTMGVLSISIALGFIVGGSETPVVGVVVSSSFSLILATLALLGKSNIEKSINSLLKKSTDENNDLKPQIERLICQIESVPKHTGKFLLVFGIFFLVGCVGGIKARNIGWLVVQAEKNKMAPWQKGSEPKSGYEAVIWLSLNEKLKSLGYNESVIASIYKIEYNKVKSDDESYDSLESAMSYLPDQGSTNISINKGRFLASN